MTLDRSFLRSPVAAVLAALAAHSCVPALALAEEPNAATVPPAPTTPPTDAPTSAAPTFTGKGLIIGSAVAGGVGLALNAGRVAWHLQGCRAGSITDDTVGGCLVSAYGDVFLSIPAWFANMASIGLAAGGGALRGKLEAHRGRPREAKTLIIAGATMVGVGGTAYLAARFARFAAVGCVTRGGLGCYRGVYTGTTIGIQLALSTVAAGAGILAFGDQYRRARRRPQVAELHVAPSLGAGYSGLVVSGRF
jgi:hypothetical protein